MKPSSVQRIPFYRSKSQEAEKDMEILLESSQFSGAVDRAYYAVFHMAQALLAGEGLEFSSHEAVIAAFGREFAKSKKLDPKFHRILMDAFDLRLTADYDVEVSVSEEEARNLITECREFLKTISSYLDRTISS